jgi:hypothetical protein
MQQLLHLPFLTLQIDFPAVWPSMTSAPSETLPQRARSSSFSARSFRRMSSSRLESAENQEATQKRLAEMGYEQELKRSLGMVSILGLSFAIMAVPFVSPIVLMSLMEGTFHDVLHRVDRRWFRHNPLVMALL